MTVLFDGVAAGMLLFLISVGLSVTLGLMHFVNLAHGAFAMAGGYVFIVLLNRLGVPFFAALALAALASAMIGVVLERLLYRRLYGAAPLDQVLFSIGLVFVSTSMATFFFGDSQPAMQLPASLSGQFHVAGVDIGAYRLFLVALGLVLAVALQMLVNRTEIGAQLRASVDNPRVARGVGIDVDGVFTTAFALGSALAGLGGALGIEMFGLNPEYPTTYIVYFLIVVAMGGAGNIKGSFLAALILGVFDVEGKYYIPQVGAFMIYAVMAATLIFKPEGLFGKAGAK